MPFLSQRAGRRGANGARCVYFASGYFGGFMRRILLMGTALMAFAWPILAQNAEVGKEYDVTIESQDSNQWVGPFGVAKVGSIVFWIPAAETNQKYHVKVTKIARNQYTDETQGSCDFQRTGTEMKGQCIDVP
jgi:hypothetical protein